MKIKLIVFLMVLMFFSCNSSNDEETISNINKQEKINVNLESPSNNGDDEKNNSNIDSLNYSILGTYAGDSVDDNLLFDNLYIKLYSEDDLIKIGIGEKINNKYLHYYSITKSKKYFENDGIKVNDNFLMLSIPIIDYSSNNIYFDIDLQLSRRPLESSSAIFKVSKMNYDSQTKEILFAQKFNISAISLSQNDIIYGTYELANNKIYSIDQFYGQEKYSSELKLRTYKLDELKAMQVLNGTNDEFQFKSRSLYFTEKMKESAVQFRDTLAIRQPGNYIYEDYEFLLVPFGKYLIGTLYWEAVVEAMETVVVIKL